MTDQENGAGARRRRDEQLSKEELEFRRHWRVLVNRVGGQKQAAAITHCSKQTASRDWNGLPHSDRLQMLCKHLGLGENERRELEVLLQRAWDAREARKNNDKARQNSDSASPKEAPPAETPSSGPPQSSGHQRQIRQWSARWHPTRKRIIVAVGAVVLVGAAVTIGVLASRGQGEKPQDPSTENMAASPAAGAGKGGQVQRVKVVSIPTASLIPTLRAQIYKDTPSPPKSMTGYEFRNGADRSLCLTVADTGALAGEQRDPVQLSPCRLTANQIWIPEEWETEGKTYTHLISDKYQAMCLNSRKTGGAPTGPGDAIMLWSCYYHAGNEAWAFQDWYQSVTQRHQPYPLCLSNEPGYCMDADKRANDPVGIRLENQEATAGQFWS